MVLIQGFVLHIKRDMEYLMCVDNDAMLDENAIGKSL